MPLRNPRFEEPGDKAGDAAHWSRRSFAGQWEGAVLGIEPYRAQERFQPDIQWRGDFDAVPSARARFTQTSGAETFEGRWQNDFWTASWPTNVVHAAFGGMPREAFLAGWPTAGFSDEFVEGLGTPAEWGGAETQEGFTVGWPAAAFVWAWSDSTGLPATFADGSAVEVFTSAAWP